MEQHYLNTNLVLETSMDVLCPPHELCYRSVSQLEEPGRTKLPLSQTSRDNGLNFPERAVGSAPNI